MHLLCCTLSHSSQSGFDGLISRAVVHCFLPDDSGAFYTGGYNTAMTSQLCWSASRLLARNKVVSNITTQGGRESLHSFAILDVFRTIISSFSQMLMGCIGSCCLLLRGFSVSNRLEEKR